MTSAGQIWDHRFSEKGWPTDPDPYLVELAEGQPVGRGLDLGAGPGRNSLWLAQKGWDMTLLDASRVGLDQARDAAGALGLTITTVCADLFDWRPEEASFNLVIVANIHPDQDALVAVLAGAALALRPGGHLYVVGHHVTSLGRQGPPDPDRLLTPERLRDALPTELRIEVLAIRDRRGGHGQGANAATADTVVVAWAIKPEAPGG
ncbi:methyltransferase domain-containing protein [Acidiferrimicrobium sp. IK]|uniref:class I SAM-dependent methyltransferase n=1 Tax=Acidiferrimicrobium sp. IK TaxID=2871700 RepID=UPI0021CB7677|nr:class I SAM-dependent methyltransferase [Acidiferrimicrobium sp. IK]MCU4185127.1 methyltransferase domain-containing protein [Acidiferrimicrobium sp. IK]